MMNLEHSFKQVTDILGIAIVQNTLKKLAHIELEKCALKMERVKAELVPFEKHFGKTSYAAWEAFRSGKLGDDGDVMEWMMLYENYLALERQYNRITGIAF